MTRHVIDDHVRHDVHAFGKARDVIPRAQPRIHLRVIDGVEAGIGAVDWMEERQHVDAAERARQRRAEQPLEIVERAAGQPIDVRDELRLVLHRPGIAPGTLATIAPARFENSATFGAGQPVMSPCRNAAANASPAPTVSATATGTPAAST